MKIKNFLLFGSLIFMFALLYVGCANSGKKTSSEIKGFINISVSGSVEGERSGTADFFQGESGKNQWWTISGHDTNPQTFSIKLQLISTSDEVSQPKPGAYKIGMDPMNGHEIFLGTFTKILDGNVKNSKSYSSIDGDGTLIIEVSNENEVKGSFEFTAHPTENGSSSAIQVSGDFHAFSRTE